MSLPNAPQQCQDPHRLAALHRYDVLDTNPEPAFDDIVGLIAQICHAPIAAIDFIDRDRLWFKAEVGIGLKELPLHESMCATALQDYSELLVVPDLQQDARFRNKPLVRSGPALRFYAGAPLRTEEGHVLGMLCVLDREPRTLTEDQAAALRMLGRQVMTQLELRRTLLEQSRAIAERDALHEKLRDAQARVDATLAAGEVATWTWDIRTDRVQADRNLAKFFDVPDASGEGAKLASYLHAVHPDDVARVTAAVQHELKHGGGYEVQYRVRGRDGLTRWILARGRVERDADGTPVRLPGMVLDLTDRVRAETAQRESVERLGLALDAAKLGDWHWDAVTDLMTLSPRAAEIFGVAPGTGLTRTAMRQLVHDDDRERTRMGASGVTPTNPMYDLEYRVHRANDGRQVWVAAKGRAQFDAAGKTTHMLGVVQDITDRKAAEAAVLGSEARFRQLADAMPQIVFGATPDGHVDYFNRQWYEYTGLPEGTIGFEHWRHVHTEEGLELAVQKWTEALRTGSAYEIEYRLRRHDGQFRWHLGRALPVRDSTGVIVRWFGTNTDIHDHKLAEESARREREQAELVVKGANVGVWYCPLPFDRLIWDETVKRHFHLSRDAEVTIDTFYACIHVDDRERTRLSIEASLRDRTPYDIDYRTVSADGTQTKWIRAMGRGYYDSAGNASRFDGITIDITDRTLTALALRESEERYRLATRATNNAIWDWNLNTHVVMWNEAVSSMYGYKPDQVVTDSKWWIDHIHEDDRERVAHSIHEVIDDPQREQWVDEYRFRRADGTYADVFDRGYVLRDAATGRALRMLGAMQDLSESKRNERERERLLQSERDARNEAEHHSRMKDEFLATLSHELRTPLNAILGWATILRGGFADADDLTQGVETIERNARAQAQIIDDLLDMSRIISGKVRLEVIPLEVTTVVRAALDTVRPAADAKAIRLHLAVDPSVSSSAVVSGDPNRMQQVLWNLLSNAIKFTPRQGHVQVRLERVEGHLEIRITDTGEGIRPEFLPFVFDRFRQADASTTRRHGGLGLGLAIVKQLVELHGGSVRVTSGGAGQGSTFTVALPLLQATAPTTESTQESDDANRRRIAAAAREQLETCEQLTGVRVLVVDDEPDARDLVRRLLVDCGAIVTTAASAQEALQRLLADRPAVLVSDIGMPDEDGYALIRQIRALPTEQGGQIPALALTAYARADDRDRALREGFHAHLAKPLEPSVLIDRVVALAPSTSR